MIKRTSINLDLELVAEARGIFGTKNTTDTVHTALREVVRREKLKALSKMRFDHMPDGWLDELRTRRALAGRRRFVDGARRHERLDERDIAIRSSKRASRVWLRRGDVARPATSCGSSFLHQHKTTISSCTLRGRLDALQNAAIGPRVWRRALDVFEIFARQGPLHHRRVQFPDLLVAAAAELAEIPVLHYDRHFELIAEVTGQPVRAIAPLGSL